MLDLESICHAIFKTVFLSGIRPFFGVIPNFWQSGLLAVNYSSRVTTMYTTSDSCRSVIVKVGVVVLMEVVVVSVFVVVVVVMGVVLVAWWWWRWW